ncbi:hypothetical protein KC686_04055 [Candidatus Woesebacteria bacterium]|nr:hypothetical protein [Candidatus Woesebacteria bacterium]
MANQNFRPGNIGEKLAEAVVKAHLYYQEVGKLYAGGHVSKDTVFAANAAYVSLVNELAQQADHQTVLLQEILEEESEVEEEASTGEAD